MKWHNSPSNYCSLLGFYWLESTPSPRLEEDGEKVTKEYFIKEFKESYFYITLAKWPEFRLTTRKKQACLTNKC